MDADVEFKWQLDIPKEYPRRGHGPCHNSDGLNQCDSMLGFSNTYNKCEFNGRPIEPLAFYLPRYSEVTQQDQSPLYYLLPNQIRSIIWEYALADDGAPSYTQDNVFRRTYGTEDDIAEVDAAVSLLQTCKAIYLETYRLPMLLNGYLSYRIPGPSRPDLERLAPWQYALIQRIDLSLKQASIEGQDLISQLTAWNPKLRHSGVYVAPGCYGTYGRPEGVVRAHKFGFVGLPKESLDHPEDGHKLLLHQAYCVDECYYQASYKYDFTARAMVARPLTHLTIRISRTDWWKWFDDPATTDDDRQLALDPACGNTTRPSVADMVALAALRRLGEHPEYNKTWGAAVGALPDLKTFELVLETFSVKKRQLETVVDCAKTWKFPLQDTQYELLWDGNVESMKWGVGIEGGSITSDDESRSGSADFDDGACFQVQSGEIDAHERILLRDLKNPDGKEGEAPSEVQEEESAIGGGEGYNEHDDLPICPVVSEYHEIYSPPSPRSINSPPSPRYSCSPPEDPPLEESWIRTATEFEVIVVRFRRKWLG